MKIRCVYCPALQAGCDPEGATVGYNNVTNIERRDENFGDHGLLWFDVFSGEKLIKSILGRSIEVVYYDEGAQ